MPFYENIFIARQDISTTQVEALADTFATLVSENGGKVEKREYWGLRNLSYRMKKNRKGHYVLFNIDAPAAAVSELERNMRINEDILRYLTIRVEALETEPSAMMQSRNRDERDRDRDRGPRRGYGDRDPREEDREREREGRDNKETTDGR
jgi:small subunit ribosomal protein S6